jgi:hypothetical protein
MQTRKNDNAFPVFDREGLVLIGEEYCWEGLSKREYFAGQALQGLLANTSVRVEKAPLLARQSADELIKQLNENP